MAVLAVAVCNLMISSVLAGEAAADAAKSSDEAVSVSDVNVVDDPLRALSTEPSASSFGFAKPLLETPRAVSFVSEEQIRLFGISTVEDLTRVVPGTYTTTRYGLQGGINVRGVAADMYYRGMKRLNMQGHVRTVLSAMDNIEVIKGPPSPLYGMGKIGGYTNLDPKSSRARTGKYLTKEQGLLQATTGAYNKAEVQAGLGVPFALGSKAAGVYLFALAEDSDSYVKHVGAEQRFIQGTMSVDNIVGPFRLETGGQAQNSITSGAYMNRVTQGLIDRGEYISGQPLVNLDLNGDGRVGYVESYLASPVVGAISGNNQALTQRYTWRTDASGNPLPLSQFANSIVGVPANMKTYLNAHPEVQCAAATIMRNAPTAALGTATSGSLVTRQIPVGFFLNPCTVAIRPVDYRGNGSYEREQNATQKMGYVDLIYDTNPDFTIKNQMFYDNLDSFKDSWLPYGENQYIKALEEKLTVTKRVPSSWLPDWLSVNSLGSVNFRDTRGFIRSSGGDFDYRQDILFTTSPYTSGSSHIASRIMFWTQLTNASYATGVPATTWRISKFNEKGAGLMFDMDFFKNTNLLIGGRYDWTSATAQDTQLFNPNTGSVTVTPALIASYLNGTACQTPVTGCPGGISPALTVSGSDKGASWSASLSQKLPWGLRPYVTFARSTLTLDGSNNLFATGTVTGGKLVGDAYLHEIGLKGASFGGKVQWTIDGFKQSRNDVSSPTDPSVGVEVTSTQTKGIESEFRWAPMRSVFINGYLTYQTAVYVVGASATNIEVSARDLGFQDVVDPTTGAVLFPAEAYLYGGRTSLVLTDVNNVYNEVPSDPDWQAGLTGNYNITKTFGVLLGATWFSDTWANRIKTVKIPEATVLNAGATWDHNSVHLKVNGYNVTDKHYFRAGLGSNSQLISVMPGRRWEASVKIDF